MTEQTAQAAMAPTHLKLRNCKEKRLSQQMPEKGPEFGIHDRHFLMN